MQIILCCGEKGRAVVYGTVEKEPVAGQAVRLTDARMVLHWSVECGGLFGLAKNGPKTSSRLTEAVSATASTEWKQYIVVDNQNAIEAFTNWKPSGE